MLAVCRALDSAYFLEVVPERSTVYSSGFPKLARQLRLTYVYMGSRRLDWVKNLPGCSQSSYSCRG